MQFRVLQECTVLQENLRDCALLALFRQYHSPPILLLVFHAHLDFIVLFLDKLLDKYIGVHLAIFVLQGAVDPLLAHLLLLEMIWEGRV